jgi:hypothetical protein
MTKPTWYNEATVKFRDLNQSAQWTLRTMERDEVINPAETRRRIQKLLEPHMNGQVINHATHRSLKKMVEHGLAAEERGGYVLTALGKRMWDQRPVPLEGQAAERQVFYEIIFAADWMMLSTETLAAIAKVIKEAED